MKEFKAKFFSAAVMVVLLAIALVSVSCNRNNAAQSGTSQVTGTLPVSVTYGDPTYFPQPAKGWTANPKYPQQPPISGVNEFPITAGKTNLRVAIPQSSSVTDYEDNDLTRFMEELTNVHVVWELLPNQNAMEKVTLMFNGGEALPDVFLKIPIPSTMLIALGSAGLIIPQQDLVEKNSFNTKALFEQKPFAKAAATSADGNIYSLVSWSAHEPNAMAMRFFINTQFLDTLGMKEPTTTDELYEYLKAVKTRDPNGNGKADEIPMISSINEWYSMVDGFIMNAFIYNETSTSSDPAARRRIFLTEDGKIDVSFNKPEYRQGLEYLRKLCAEGLLAPESFTMRGSDVKALVENEDAVIVGSTPNGGPHTFADTTGKRRELYKAIAPIKGPNGLQVAYFNKYLGPEVGDFVITKDCKIPEVAIKWADYQHTIDFTMKNRYGVVGRDWVIPAAGVLGVDGKPAEYEEILRMGQPTKAYWGGGLRWARWGAYKRPMTQGDPFDLEKVLWDAYLEYLPYAFQRGVPLDLTYTLEESRRYSELNRLIIEYVEQSMTSFVTGRLDINRDWNNYLATLDRMGLSELIQLTQTAFDRTWKTTLGY